MGRTSINTCGDEQEVLSKYDVMTVAEGAGVTAADALDYVDADRHELNMLYHFEGVSSGLPARQPESSGSRRATVWSSSRTSTASGTGSLRTGVGARSIWATTINREWSTRWGNDAPQWRELSSKMLTTFLLTMRATPYYYAGDELCMTNIKFDTHRGLSRHRIDQLVSAGQEQRGRIYRHSWRRKRSRPATMAGRHSSGTNRRTQVSRPGTPWLKVNSNYTPSMSPRRTTIRTAA